MPGAIQHHKHSYHHCFSINMDSCRQQDYQEKIKCDHISFTHYPEEKKKKKSDQQLTMNFTQTPTGSEINNT